MTDTCALTWPDIPDEVADTFWKHVPAKVDGQCWEWQGSRSWSGYGKLYVAHYGEMIPTHRLSYRIAAGPFPTRLLVCHTCDNPPCVNPDHLFLGTHRDNAEDMIQKGRHIVPPLTLDTVLKIRSKPIRSYTEHLEVAINEGVSIRRVCSSRKRAAFKKTPLPPTVLVNYKTPREARVIEILSEYGSMSCQRLLREIQAGTGCPHSVAFAALMARMTDSGDVVSQDQERVLDGIPVIDTLYSLP